MKEYILIGRATNSGKLEYVNHYDEDNLFNTISYLNSKSSNYKLYRIVDTQLIEVKFEMKFVTEE